MFERSEGLFLLISFHFLLLFYYFFFIASNFGKLLFTIEGGPQELFRFVFFIVKGGVRPNSYFLKKFIVEGEGLEVNGFFLSI